MLASLPTITSAIQQIQSGELEPIELVEFCLARIRKLDDQVRAWVVVDDDGARREAERLGKEARHRQGRHLGTLYGIPIGIKDIIDIQGMPTKAGSPLRRDHVAQEDAAVVAKLRQSGAIILGKTVTTEFACFDPSPTRNPWNLERTPGGSSSGSAAAVAAEMCIAALGSQTGGSIIRPASYCGIAGFKPRYGGVSVDGVVPVSKHLDHVGPMARTVSDLHEVWYAIQEPPPYWGPDIRIKVLLKDDMQPPTIGVIEDFFMDQADDAVKECTRRALATLEKAGATIKTIGLPDSFQDVHELHRRIMAAEAAIYHRKQFSTSRESYGPKITELIVEGMTVSAVDHAAAREHQRQFREDLRRVLPGSMIALTPSTPTPAPTLETTGDPSFNSPWSYAGLPTVTIPCGLSADGLPCGLQLIEGPDGHHRALADAYWCERQLKFHETHPLPLLDGVPR